MFSQTIVASFISVFFFSCINGQKNGQINKIEVVEYIVKQYYPDAPNLSKPFWDFREKCWFADSFAIEEIRQLNITENTKGIKSQRFDIRHYRFTDLRKQMIYEFNTFTDSAKLIRKYAYSDSVPVVSGWGFNKAKNWEYKGNTELIADTIYDNNPYKRAKITKVLNDIHYTLLCYFDCARSGTIFNMDPDLSAKTGCPLVKLYYFSPQKKGLHMTLEVKFISSSLTKEEKKIFDAWRNFTDVNP
jgi:hypothetical protein